MSGTVTATSVFEFQAERQEKSKTRPSIRSEKLSSLSLRVGDVFNPFQLFIGAMIPSAVLRNPDLSPSAKLVFARLAQFAGRQRKAWPSDQTWDARSDWETAKRGVVWRSWSAMG